MQLKQFIITEARKKGYSLETLSLEMGKCKSSLRRTLRIGSLKLRDFMEILEILGSEFEINYKKENIEIVL